MNTLQRYNKHSKLGRKLRCVTTPMSTYHEINIQKHCNMADGLSTVPCWFGGAGGKCFNWGESNGCNGL